jgi:hypothetical protein
MSYMLPGNKDIYFDLLHLISPCCAGSDGRGGGSVHVGGRRKWRRQGEQTADTFIK